MADSPAPPSKSIKDALRSAETDLRPAPMTELNQEALEVQRNRLVARAWEIINDAPVWMEGWTLKFDNLADDIAAELAEYEASLAERTRERDEARERLAAKFREVADLQQDPMWRLKEGMRERAEAADARADAAEARVKALTKAGLELADLMDDVVRGEYKPDSFTTQPMRAALASSDAAPESKEGE